MMSLILGFGYGFYLLIDDLLEYGALSVSPVFLNILVSVVGMSFMYCGWRIIENYDGNLRKYYINGILMWLAPFAAVSLILLVKQIGFSISLGFAKDYIKGFLGASIEGDYWFIYKLTGFYLVAPFFAKMLNAMSQKEKRSLLMVIVSYIAFFDVGIIFNYRIVIDCFPFLSWLLYLVLGYLVLYIDWNEKENRIIAYLGVVSIIISSMEVIYFPDVNKVIDDLCLTRIAMCAAGFLFLKKYLQGLKRRWDIPVYLTFLLLPLFKGWAMTDIIWKTSVKYTAVFLVLLGICYLVSMCMERLVKMRYEG